MPSTRYVTEVDNPRSAAGRDLGQRPALSNGSVAFVCGGMPLPAAISYLNLRPESLFKSFHSFLGVLQYTHYTQGA
jgi:hypothetical protein